MKWLVGTVRQNIYRDAETDDKLCPHAAKKADWKDW